MAKGNMPLMVDPSKVGSNRQEAIALGLKFYHGRVCVTHGTTVRRLSSAECPACVSERSAKWIAENRDRFAQKKKEWHEKHFDKVKAYQAEYHQANKEKKNKTSKDWYEANKEHSIELARRWQQTNPEARAAISRRWVENNREQHNASAARWQKANPERTSEKTKRWQRQHVDKVNANTAVRRARKRLAVPSWLSAEHRSEIVAFFARAKAEGLEVDHIIPIAGCRVCGAHGLHVPWNMQLLTSSANSGKSNRCQDCWKAEEAEVVVIFQPSGDAAA